MLIKLANALRFCGTCGLLGWLLSVPVIRYLAPDVATEFDRGVFVTQTVLWPSILALVGSWLLRKISLERQQSLDRDRPRRFGGWLIHCPDDLAS
jgi:hypothetical protein